MVMQLAAAVASPILQGLFGNRQQQQQMHYAQQQLNLAREQADLQEELAKAARTDAYGNTSRYVPGRGFVTELNPIEQAILEAGQSERLQRATTDAQRNRTALSNEYDRRDEFAGAAADDLRDYRYGDRQSEEALQSLYTALARRELDKGVTDFTNAAGRQALRAGNSSALENIVRTGSQQRGQNLLDAALRGKVAGTQAFNAQEGQRGNLLANALRGHAAGSTSQQPVMQAANLGSLGNSQSNQIAQTLNAINSGTSNVSSALTNMSRAAGQNNGMGDAIAKALSAVAKYDFGGGTPQAAPSPWNYITSHLDSSPRARENQGVF
jgi:hypothetical protein